MPRMAAKNFRASPRSDRADRRPPDRARLRDRATAYWKAALSDTTSWAYSRVDLDKTFWARVRVDSEMDYAAFLCWVVDLVTHSAAMWPRSGP